MSGPFPSILLSRSIAVIYFGKEDPINKTIGKLAFYFMHDWLANYEYRTKLSWWIFAIAGAGALLITLITVSFQAIKTALGNIVKSLRTE